MSWAYCAMAAAHVWLGRTCAVANYQQQQRQHGCADGSNMILYLAFILDDTVGEWNQVGDLFLCIKTPHVMILDCRFICVKLVWFETSNETTCNDRREGPGGEFNRCPWTRGNIGPHRGMQTVRLIGYGSSLGEGLPGYENLYSSQP